MRKENLRLKRNLIVQSFLPLFIILFIQYFDFGFWKDIQYFFVRISEGDYSVFLKIWISASFWRLILCAFSFICIIKGFLSAWMFSDIQMGGLDDAGEKVKIEEGLEGTSAGFFVTFIIPLLVDDIVSFRGILIFGIILMFLMILMWKTNLYYQNPVLAILGYSVCRIKIINPISDGDKDKELIGIIKGDFDESKVILKKYISDNVYYITNRK